MAKNPVFPLYYNDILGSCKTWSDEEFGAYMRLLIEQWDNGSLPKDYQRLTRIATSLSTTWSMLKSKFEETEDGLKNKKLELVRDKILKHKEKQRENISKRYQTSTKTDTKVIPLETEDEKENSIRGIVVFNAEEEILKSQVRFEQICMNAGQKDLEAGKLSLRKYHLYLEEKEQYPKPRKSLFAGFEKWLLNEKKYNHNGTHQQISPGGTKLGTSEARIKKASEW